MPYKYPDLPENRAKQRAYHRAYENQPEVKARRRAARKIYYATLTPEQKAKRREWWREYIRRPDRVAKRIAEADKYRGYGLKNRNNNPYKSLWHSCRARAKSGGQLFTITVDDLHWPTRCPVLGIELDYTFRYVGPQERRTLNPNRASLDRWDNSKGYVPGNVFVISWKANRIKHDHDAETLEAVAAYARRGILKES